MYGRGAVLDHAHVVEKELAETPLARLPGLAASGLLPSERNYAHLLDGILNQGMTSSCVAHALSTSVYTRAKILDKPLPRPSRRLIYNVAILLDSPHQKMVDQGCRPAVAVYGTQIYGLVSENLWEWDEKRIVSDDPPQDVFQHALEARVEGSYRIASGVVCSAGIRRALVSGYIPIFTMPTDESYDDYSGGIYDGPNTKDEGLHCQAIVGYGPGYFIIAGSWGPGFGENGLIRIKTSYFDTNAVRDVLVPTVVPGELA